MDYLLPSIDPNGGTWLANSVLYVFGFNTTNKLREMHVHFEAKLGKSDSTLDHARFTDHAKPPSWSCATKDMKGALILNKFLAARQIKPILTRVSVVVLCPKMTSNLGVRLLRVTFS